MDGILVFYIHNSRVTLGWAWESLADGADYWVEEVSSSWVLGERGCVTLGMKVGRVKGSGSCLEGCLMSQAFCVFQHQFDAAG